MRHKPEGSPAPPGPNPRPTHFRIRTMNLNELLKWRYATKKMNPQKAVPQAKVDSIIEAVRLTATSSGLQPY